MIMLIANDLQMYSENVQFVCTVVTDLSAFSVFTSFANVAFCIFFGF